MGVIYIIEQLMLMAGIICGLKVTYILLVFFHLRSKKIPTPWSVMYNYIQLLSHVEVYFIQIYRT